MPAFNAERTIAGAINSILSQTHENWELIIVNDGSTDKTEEAIKGFADSRIRLFTIPNSGVSEARNVGNRHANGNICVVQDADDYSMPDRLEKIAKFFEESDTDVLVHGLYINTWDSQYGCMRRVYAPPSTDAINNKINGVVAFRKKVWEAKPYRVRYAYDWMMHLDWTLSGFKYATLDEGLYEYIRYAGSASDRFEKEGKRAEAFKIIKEIIRNEYPESLSSFTNI